MLSLFVVYFLQIIHANVYLKLLIGLEIILGLLSLCWSLCRFNIYCKIDGNTQYIKWITNLRFFKFEVNFQTISIYYLAVPVVVVVDALL